MYLGSFLPQGSGATEPSAYRSTLMIPGGTPGTAPAPASAPVPAPAPASVPSYPQTTMFPYQTRPIVPGVPGVFDVTRGRAPEELTIPGTVITAAPGGYGTAPAAPVVSAAPVAPVAEKPNWLPALIAGGVALLAAFA